MCQPLTAQALAAMSQSSWSRNSASYSMVSGGLCSVDLEVHQPSIVLPQASAYTCSRSISESESSQIARVGYSIFERVSYL